MSPAANRRLLRELCLMVVLAPLVGAQSLFAAGKVELKEDPADARVYQVTGSMLAKGKAYTRDSNGSASPRTLNVDYQFAYPERRLTGIGREAQSLRTIRHYDKSKAQITIGEQITYAQLREEVRMVIANGQREGMSLYSPSGPFTFSELDLIRIPGDSAALSALLPLEAVEAGDTWKPSEWVLQLLVGMEAVEKSALTCKVESMDGSAAKITFVGEITGADRGAAAGLKVKGTLEYDLTGKFIRQFQMEIADKHSIGVVSPGLDVEARIALDRSVIERPVRFSDQEIKQLPLEPQAGQLLLIFDVPTWGIRFFYDRQWHLFQHLRDLAVFRLLDKGRPLTQLNLHHLPKAAPGVTVSRTQFENEVRTVMKNTFGRMLQSETVPTTDGKTIYRVEVLGQVERPVAKTTDKDGKSDQQATVEQVPYQWIHYLVTAPDGRRMTFVFILEPKSAEALQGRDLSLVTSLQFVEPRDPPVQPAGP